ncbi:MAG TPA: dockerin type I domain-containing protein [Chthoniobacterales bacterium]
MPQPRPCVLLSLLAFSSALCIGLAEAQNVWQAPHGSRKWSAPENWSGGVPDIESSVLLPNLSRPALNVDATIAHLTLQGSGAVFGDSQNPGRGLNVTWTTTHEDPTSFGVHFHALSGNTFSLGTLTNFSEGVLTGHYVCEDGDDVAQRVPTVIQFRGADVIENLGDVELYGADALMLDQETALNAFRNLKTNSGFFFLESGLEHSTSGDLINNQDFYIFGSYSSAPTKYTVPDTLLNNEDGYVSVYGNAQLIVQGDFVNRTGSTELAIYNSAAATSGDAMITVGGDLTNEPKAYISIEGAGARNARLIVQGDVTNQGDIALEGSGSLEVSGVLTLAAGSLTLRSSSGVEAVKVAAQRIEAAAGTTFSASGAIFADLVERGNFSPGGSGGDAIVYGRVTFGATAALHVEIGGTTAGAQYDRILHQSTGTGGVLLAGDLVVSFADGFERYVQRSDTFTILSSNLGLSGAFANVSSGARVHTANGSSSFVVTYAGSDVVLSGFEAEPLALLAVASQQSHAGTIYEIALPLAGEPAVECRRGSAPGEYTLVLRFNNELIAAKAAMTSGGGAVSGAYVSQNSLVVPLTGIANEQTITLITHDVSDTLGQTLPASAISMRVLVGDVNGDGSVNSGDALQTRNRSGQSASAINFRSDVNTDGTINGGDALLVRARSGSNVR